MARKKIEESVTEPEPQEAKVGKPCPNCGKRVASRASVCPFCHADIPKKAEKAAAAAGTRRVKVEPTLSDLREAKRLATEQGGVAALMGKIETLRALAKPVGGIDALYECLELLTDLQ